MSDIALIVQGDALRLPLADASVDLVVTSPPFAFLRAYDTGYPHLEIGAEATPAEFLEHLWQATAEMVRVLKPTGSIFVDLGDKYVNPSVPGNRATIPAGGRPGQQPSEGHRSAKQVRRFKAPDGGMPAKSLMLLPERYRIGCVDQLGLIARAVIIWDKANSLPESIRDRVRRNHEDWVHLVKQPRYYSAVDEIREPYSPGSAERVRQGFRDKQVLNGIGAGQRRSDELAEGYEVNPLGKLPGSVWRLPSEPLRLPDHLGVQHYAAMPSEWPRRLILGWSPPGICLDCEQGRVPVVEINRVPHWKGGTNGGAGDGGGVGDRGHGKPRTNRADTILGYACACTPYTDHGTQKARHDRRAAEARARTRIPSSLRTAEPYDPTVPVSHPEGLLASRFTEAAIRQQPGRSYVPSTSVSSLRSTPGDEPTLPSDQDKLWREYHLDGWRPPPTRPAVILDPFSGTGTTPMVARALGRIGVGVDLSMPYCRAARWRIHHDAGKAISRTWTERQGSLL